MTKEEAKELMPIITAFANGEDIQIQGGGIWNNLWSEDVSFDLPPRCYRIKPKPRKVWVNEYDNGNFSIPHPSKEEAEMYSGEGRLACHEIELPPVS
jgi:hypothetical protein